MADTQNTLPIRGRLRPLIIALCDGNKTAAEIADHVGCSYCYVIDVIHSEKLQVKPDNRPSNINGPWTDERIELLKTLWAEGYSASRVAALLDHKPSRNAVIAKIHRLGLSQRSKLVLHRAAPGRKSRAKAKHPVKVDFPKPEIEPLPLPRSDDIARKSLSDLERNECRYPVGDPREIGFGFCALEIVPGKSYCAGHLARCVDTIPSRPRPAKVPANDREVVEAGA